MGEQAMDSNENSEEDKRTQHTAGLAIGLICLVVGLPLWWKTTEIYRVSLPYSDIEQLSDRKIEYLTEIEVIWATDLKKEDLLLTDVALQLNRLLETSRSQRSTLIPVFRVAVREAESSEKLSIKKAEKVSDLTSVFASEQLNKYNVIVTSATDLIPQPVLAPNNNIFLPYNQAGVEGLSAQIAQLIRDVVRDSAVSKNLEAAQGLRSQRPDKDVMRSYRFHSGYDITFTLMVPEPQLVQVDWDIAVAINDYFQPMLSSLDEYVKFSVTSQILYLLSLGGKPKKGEGFYYYQEQDLPHVINPLESKLGSHASNNPGLNFIVVIPTQSKSPLYIMDKRGQQLPSNSFLSPRWGGVMIYNTADLNKNGSNPETGPISLDMHRMMEVFVSQTRLLLNIQAQMVTKEMKIINTGSSKLQQWEVAGWLRCRCVENLATATSTLQSLAQLLEEIGNIVINDEIGKEVESAVAAIKESHSHLASGMLKEAFLSSRAAIEASELAFFHPSLLELLYFPEDQKFAIYIPLFLPVSIPLVLSMFQAIKWFRQRKKLKEE